MAETRASKRALDFTNVKDGGQFNPVHKSPGDYLMEVFDVTEGRSKNDNDTWTFHCRLVDQPRATYPYRCALTDASLWKIRNLFVACGIAVPKKKVNVDPNKIVGKKFGAGLEDDEYEDKLRSAIGSVFPADDVPAPSKKSRKVEEEIEEEEVEDEIEDEIDVEDL